MSVSNVDYEELSENSEESKESLGTRFDLVKDVKVNLSVLVGGCAIKVSELFDLKNGSVLTLDKDLHEPVELTYQGGVIARGELVAVEDNFGIKITEIKS